MEPPWVVALSVPVAWGEMDAFGHVNNIVYLRWFESARIGFFEKVGLATAASAARTEPWPILARSEIDYRSPVVYPDVIDVSARVTKLGTTSFTMSYRVESRAQGKRVAEGVSVVVMIDPNTGQKTPLPAQLRSKIEGLEKKAG